MKADTISKSCACLLLKTGRKIPRKISYGKTAQAPRGGWKCNNKYVPRIKSEFVNEAAFCRFFGSMSVCSGIIKKVALLTCSAPVIVHRCGSSMPLKSRKDASVS